MCVLYNDSTPESNTTRVLFQRTKKVGGASAEVPSQKSAANSKGRSVLFIFTIYKH